MTLQRQIIFWVGALLVFILCVWVLQGILLPFIAGLVMAYFLDPVADALERLGLPRFVATLVILGFGTLVLIVVLFLFVPILADQVGRFAANLPGLLTALIARFNELAPDWLKDLIARSGTNIPANVSEIAGRAAIWIASLLSSILSGGLALVNLFSLLIITPIVAYYLLTDWDRIVAKVDSWLPRAQLETIRGLAREIDAAMAGFIRGQGTVCLCLGAMYALGLTFLGLNFGLLIGLGAGLLSFVPFVGTLAGAMLGIGVAIVQYWPDWASIVAVALVFALGQFVEGNFLSPRLVGNRVGLHPVWLMFALFAFGYLFGFVGVLLAVPLAAAAGVLARFALGRYLESRIYLGPQPAAGPRRRGKK